MPKKSLMALLVLPFYLLFALSYAVPARAGLLSSLRSDIDSLTGQYQSLQQQRAQTQAKVNYLQAQADVLQGQLNQVEGRIRGTNAGIARGQAQVGQMNVSIAALSDRMAGDRVKEARDRGEFDQILVSTYENGPLSYLQVILGARSFGDFLTRVAYTGAILSHDRSVLAQLFTDQQALAAETRLLAADRQSQLVALADLSQLRIQQKDQAAQKNTLLRGVQAAKEKELADLTSEDDAMKYISGQIEALQEKYGGRAGSVAPAARWLWPVPGYTTVTSGYTWRYIFGRREFHKGLDIAAPDGTPIIASNSGVVLYAGPAEGFGDWIIIKNSDGLMGLYGDMFPRGVWVSPGQVVSAGQEIGAVGANGDSTGPHLHFGIITGFDSEGYAIAVDPTKYVSP